MSFNMTRASFIASLVLHELEEASSKFNAFNNAHEGYAVILEEMDELWECIKLNQHKHPERDARIVKEAIQVAAMAIRLLVDCSNVGVIT